MKTKLIYYGILISLISILLGSVSHLTYTFSTLEPKTDSGIVSFVISCGIEAGMLAVAFGVAERRRLKQSAKDLFAYLTAFGIINFFGNTYFAISVYTNVRNLKWADIQGVDFLVVLTVLMLSSSLPLLVIALTELLSIFQVKMTKEEQREAERKKNLPPKDNNTSNKKTSGGKKEFTEKEVTVFDEPEIIAPHPVVTYEKVPIRVYPPDEIEIVPESPTTSFEKKILRQVEEDDGDDFFPNKRIILPRGSHTQFSMA